MTCQTVMACSQLFSSSQSPSKQNKPRSKYRNLLGKHSQIGSVAEQTFLKQFSRILKSKRAFIQRINKKLTVLVKFAVNRGGDCRMTHNKVYFNLQRHIPFPVFPRISTSRTSQKGSNISETRETMSFMPTFVYITQDLSQPKLKFKREIPEIRLEIY